MTRPQFGRRAAHRAQELLATWTAAKPWRANLWRALDTLRQQRPMAWPRAVYAPLEECGEVVAEAWRRHGQRPTPASVVAEAAQMQGLAAWRLTRGVYRYDETLAAALRTTPLAGDLPADVLLRLPEWAVYIETGGELAPTTTGPVPLIGVLAWLDWVSAAPRDAADWTADRNHAQLMLGLDMGEPHFGVANIPLVGTLEDAIQRNVDQMLANNDRLGSPRPAPGYEAAARTVLPGLIARVLYLCAEDADLGGRRPERPAPTRTKHGYRIFPAERLTVWEVGVRLGSAIRRAEAADSDARGSGGHASPRPHVRRAHWHTFIAGPRAKPEQQERRLRWLPPIPVNVEDVDTLPTVVHTVEPQGEGEPDS